MDDRLRQLSELKVSEIMITDLLFTFPNEKISVSELKMVRKNIGGLPVVKDRKNKQLIGIITQRDIRLAKFAMNLDSPNKTVKDLMIPDPFVVKQNNTLKETLEIMFENKIQRIPVVDENKVLIGLVIQNDILKTLLKFMKK